MVARNEIVEVPRYFEIEKLRRSVGRRFWFLVLFLGVLTLLSLLMAFVAFARPIPVVVFDSGRPLLFTDTATPRQNLQDVRITYFIEEFIRRWVGVDSINIEEDMTESLAMMTPAFRQVVLADDKEIARRAAYKGQNVRTRVGDWNVRIGRYDPADFDGKVHVLATGKMTFEPRFGEVDVSGPDGTQEVSRRFLTQLVLQRVPVTKLSIHGLLVEYAHTRFFESEEQLKAYMLERSAAQ